MFGWFTSKKDKKPAGFAKTPAKPQSRDDIVATAMQNARTAREAIGEENLQKLAALLNQQQQKKVEDTSPAAQAKKIIASMDKQQVSDFLKSIVREDQTRH